MTEDILQAAKSTGICLYRSLSAMLWQDWRLPVSEHQSFFLADGLGFPYSSDPAQTTWEDNRRLCRTLFSRLGVAHHYRAGPVREQKDILEPLSRGGSLLLYVHVDALPYDRSGALRGNAYHCIRVRRFREGALTFIDDFVPAPRGGYTTRTGTMDWNQSHQYFVGRLWLEGESGKKEPYCFPAAFWQSQKDFLRGSRRKNRYVGAAALERLAQEVRLRCGRERTQRWYLELAAILKYQWYAAFHYLLLAAQELGLLTGGLRENAIAMEHRWRTVLRLLAMTMSEDNELCFRRFSQCVDDLVKQLVCFVEMLADAAGKEAGCG